MDGFLCGSAEIPLSLQGESGSDMVNKRLTRRNRCQMAGSEDGARLSKHGRITIGVECPANTLIGWSYFSAPQGVFVWAEWALTYIKRFPLKFTQKLKCNGN